MKITFKLMLLLFLCFTFEAQAQITKIDTYKNKLNNSTKAEKNALEFQVFGPISQLFFSEDGTPTLLWKEQGPVKTVYLSSGQVNKLKKSEYNGAYKTTETLIIFWKKGDLLALTPDHLAAFKSLKYIILSSYDELNINEVKILLKGLLSSDSTSQQVEIILSELERPS